MITSNVDISNKELSYEALFNDTLGFKKIPNKLGKSTGDTVYTFEQVASWTNDIVVKANSNTDITICYSFMKTKEEAINSYSINNDLFDNSIFNNELTKLE